MASTTKSLSFSMAVMMSIFMLVSSSLSDVRLVCKSATDQKFCLSSLIPYPGALNANISQLAVITANISVIESTKVRDFIVGLSRSEKGGLAVIKECVDFYESAQMKLLHSMSILERPIGTDVGLVNSLQSGALTFMSTCLREMKQEALKLAPLVENRSRSLQKMIDDALCASNLLYQIGSL